MLEYLSDRTFNSAKFKACFFGGSTVSINSLVPPLRTKSFRERLRRLITQLSCLKTATQFSKETDRT